MKPKMPANVPRSRWLNHAALIFTKPDPPNDCMYPSMLRITMNRPSIPQNEATPKIRFIVIVPAAPSSIARLPPSLSTSRPLITCPQA